MKYLFDTSSLLVLARYYLPFDKEGYLLGWIRNMYETKDMVLLDAVVEESKHVSQCIIQTAMPFLFEKNDFIVDTADLLPCHTRKFDHLVSNNFAITALVRGEKVDFSALKQHFLNSGDGKLIMYAYNSVQNGQSDFCIVTEETRTVNDNKPFKKIPLLCDIINAQSLNVVQLLLRTNMQIVF